MKAVEISSSSLSPVGGWIVSEYVNTKSESSWSERTTEQKAGELSAD